MANQENKMTLRELRSSVRPSRLGFGTDVALIPYGLTFTAQEVRKIRGIARSNPLGPEEMTARLHAAGMEDILNTPISIGRNSFQWRADNLSPSSERSDFVNPPIMLADFRVKPW